MKNRINYILIGLLWLLAVSLGASFWFNTKYGFNIFSVQHWQYLAYMQASNQPVRVSFYISLLFIICIAVFGLYWLLQPRIRKIVLPVFEQKTAPTEQPHDTVKPVAPTTISEEKQPSTTPIPVAPNETPADPTNIPPRPPRLNIPVASRSAAPVPRVPLMSSTTPQRFEPDVEFADIHEIFKSAGFVYKGSPRIKGVQTSIIAIGTDEVLWIGATGVSTSDMQRAVDTLHGVFADTLDDIEIHINAFIIAAPDNGDNSLILHFASVDDLRAYISEHPNTPLPEDDVEDFDAYSGYIGTVVDYIGKI